jgi:putative endonuclease
MAKPFFAYILLCADGSYYVGHTDDLEKRLWEHQEGGKCVYTSARRPVTLVWSQDFNTREDAKEAELKIKKWSRAKKEALIRGDYDAISLAAEKNWEGYRRRRELRVEE